MYKREQHASPKTGKLPSRLHFIGVTFWFALGIMLWNWPMMIANAVTFALTVVIIVVKLYCG